MLRHLLRSPVPVWIEAAAIVLFFVLAVATVAAYGEAGTTFLVRKLAAQVLDAGELYTMDTLAQPPATTGGDPAWTNAELTKAMQTVARHAGIVEMFLYIDTADRTTLVNVSDTERTTMDQKIAAYRTYLEEYARRHAEGEL